MKSTFERIQKSSRLKSWTGDHYQVYQSIDMHTCGEPLRIVLGALPFLSNMPILAHRRNIRSNYDYIRRVLMMEPRGHSDMYGCFVVPPNEPQADFGILFIHNEGYSTMCGHAIIAITKLAAELGWKEPEQDRLNLLIEAPCGLVESSLDIKNSDEFAITFRGVPSFVYEKVRRIEVAGLGTVEYVLAYGGAFYAYTDADILSIPLATSHADVLKATGRAIKKAIIDGGTVVTHPFEEDLGFLYGVIFHSGKVEHSTSDLRNVCVFADGEVDRSPTGSGVCGKLAIMSQSDSLEAGESLIIESILGTRFKGKVERTVRYGDYKAVVPLVSGNAYVTGQHQFVVDDRDPLAAGFLLH